MSTGWGHHRDLRRHFFDRHDISGMLRRCGGEVNSTTRNYVNSVECTVLLDKVQGDIGWRHWVVVIDDTISDQAQAMTIAFDGLAL